MKWNLFWGMYVFAFALACWICFYLLVVRKMRKGNRCTVHTVGRVVGASKVRYNGLTLPLLEYQVNGKVYRVAGPKFRSGSVMQINTPWESSKAEIETNLTTRENLPLHLNVKIRKNSFVNIENSPLFQLYPVGSEADIFYNPEKPKEAFVQRYEGVSRWLRVLLVGVAVLLTIIGLCIVFGPEIVMSW